MVTKLFYFTGTGNTLYIAKRIAAELGDATVEPVTRANPVIDEATEAVGIIFPVYGWGMPEIVGRFVDRLQNVQDKYMFAVCDYGGTLFASLKSIQRRLRNRKINLDAGFAIRMPVNYIPMFTVLSPEKEKEVLRKALEKIAVIASVIKNRRKSAVEMWKIPVINGLLLSMHNKMIEHIYEEDKHFRVTDRCNGCGTCEKVCPVANIAITKGRPVWNHACQQCFACLHWCPQTAIQYGKVPTSRGRYHNPEITLQEMIDQQSIAESTSERTGPLRIMPD